ncbi:MAG: amidohydrolase 2, partial [Candidatus Acidoferrum typicum]|nr:amidohydrolase 2 [Candidatus Acidoferrum typicum]
MVKPSALDLIKHGRKDFADVEKYSTDPKAFLAFLDTLGVERAGLINYVAPNIIGFTPEVNDWGAKYCSVAPDRLIAFGGVLPGTVPDAGAEVDRLGKLGIRAIKMHPSHQVLSPNDYIEGNRGLAAVYERAQANGMPVMIHTGTSI